MPLTKPLVLCKEKQLKFKLGSHISFTMLIIERRERQINNFAENIRTK